MAKIDHERLRLWLAGLDEASRAEWARVRPSGGMNDHIPRPTNVAHCGSEWFDPLHGLPPFDTAELFTKRGVHHGEVARAALEAQASKETAAGVLEEPPPASPT